MSKPAVLLKRPVPVRLFEVLQCVGNIPCETFVCSQCFQDYIHMYVEPRGRVQFNANSRTSPPLGGIIQPRLGNQRKSLALTSQRCFSRPDKCFSFCGGSSLCFSNRSSHFHSRALAFGTTPTGDILHQVVCVIEGFVGLIRNVIF